MSLPRLVLFVEGKGDVKAVPQLAKRLIHFESGFGDLSLEPGPFKVNGLGSLVKDDCEKWRRLIGAAAIKKPFAGVLLVLDGDIDNVPSKWSRYVNLFGTKFCPYRAAAVLCEVAKEQGAGQFFSVAVSFAINEFESWIIAGIEGIRGVELASNRGKVPEAARFPTEVKLDQVRDAKELLRLQLPTYDQSLDQAVLASKLDINFAIERSRSFRRMHSAVRLLVNATRINQHIVSPLMSS